MSYSDPRKTAVCDTECYRDYWLIYFRDVESNNRRYFEMYPGHPLDIDGLRELLRRLRIVTFNGNNYDVPMISLALAGANCAELKRASDGIILADVKPWEFYDLHECVPPKFLDHIDLIEVAPGQSGLKQYGGRLHSRRMQDLPIEPDASISPDDRIDLRDYCGNDLQTTIDLYDELAEQIAIRNVMSDEYGIDLRSKSDAQIAEAVIRHEAEKLKNRRIRKPDQEPAGRFYYRPPEFVRFRTKAMQDVLNQVCRIPLIIDRNGRVKKTDDFEKLEFTIGTTTYKMGIGGLHSQESNRSVYTDDDAILVDEDVTSYYPKLILNNNLIPPAIGPVFQTIYRGIYERRIAAKRAKQKAVAETLKIVLNGTFGKLGQPGSILYAPKQMITVTLTGQLSLLMAIERLEMRGIKVVSANTDGFTSLVPRDKMDLFKLTLADWEWETDFGLEELRYRSVHSRGINDYIAIPFKFDNGAWNEDEIDKPKLKGTYAPSGPGQPAAMGLKKNPSVEICTDAVVEYLKNGTPIEETIEACQDIRRFVTIRQVRGGGEKDGEYLGKYVRWYYGVGERGGITYRESGNTVPKSEGAKPCMELPDDFPDDIDYDWYARECYGILKDLGVRFVDPAYRGRSGTSYARLPDKKNIHLIDLSTGVALCGAQPPGPRVRWVEYDAIPQGHRFCTKCRKEDSL
ncbi:DNA polymerase [Burkholderia phage vB_BceS_AH2]|uniref:DNA polymerase n=1 Tax=Burkholderia phage vB_BceS_AH2 TaxID=1133022 RepID=I6NPA3_9CAUD|nr:DNA polymerase [Burkholderia phage vB_BceS_AH2]AEY69583.1 DNA polymerase [Burkholderia phage vB_BceS_AH2]